MPRQTKKPTPGIVDPRDLTKTSPQPDYDDIDASDEAELSKKMTKSPGEKGETSSARKATRKGAISRISKAQADQPRRKMRGGTGPR
jgi:hypothetical protein